MTPLLTIEVDPAPVLRALDRAGEEIEQRVKGVARDTAERLVRHAQTRVARATGATAEGIHLEETHDGTGYIVLPSDWSAAWHTRRGRSHTQKAHSGVPRWLEFGTVHMSPRPFFFQGVQLEAAGHDRRLREAVQDGIDVAGLGD